VVKPIIITGRQGQSWTVAKGNDVLLIFRRVMRAGRANATFKSGCSVRLLRKKQTVKGYVSG
jgi:hypothetical protein